MGTLDGKSALVTGGSRGLGKAIASKLLLEGARVLICGRDRQALRQASVDIGATQDISLLTSVPCDVRSPATVWNTVQRSMERTGRLDILVCNAGIYGPIGLTEETRLTNWQDAIAINLFGVVAFCQQSVPIMRTQGRGKIILISGGGVTAPLPRFAAYAASKAAVVAFGATLAEELKGSGIDVNSIAPGALNTRFTDQVIAAGPECAGQAFWERMVSLKTSDSDNRDRAAALVAFLASPACDGITGRLISALWDKWEQLPEERDSLKESDKYTMRRVV